ncbi:hypothetical protein [uncultured Fusobacterium sp.]|uniref:hypothetical protein n=1 Tax=uncultured Fusobacterium sp. TaxID=159267 RepID=UPI00259A4AA0|nr:hypothetical protein [uncultured Fusobacterium sp.]
MKNFVKKQCIKISLYIGMLTVLTFVGYIFEVNISILANISSFITFIFVIILQKTWLEDYKIELNQELENYKVKLSKYTLVTKLQYDLEFKIYTEIYEKIFLLFIETDKLRPYTPVINKNEDENIKERLNSFMEAYNETLNLLNKYKPFYSKEIYLVLKKVQDICYKEFEYVKATSFLQFNYLMSNERKKEIQEKLDKISDLIRERIENMKIVE